MKLPEVEQRFTILLLLGKEMTTTMMATVNNLQEQMIAMQRDIDLLASRIDACCKPAVQPLSTKPLYPSKLASPKSVNCVSITNDDECTRHPGCNWFAKSGNNLAFCRPNSNNSAVTKAAMKAAMRSASPPRRATPELSEFQRIAEQRRAQRGFP